MKLLSQKLSDAKKGSVAVHQDEVVTLQDDYGKMTTAGIKELWAKLDRLEKRTFIWIAWKVLGFDEALSILSSTVIADERADIDLYLDNEQDALKAEREALAERERQLVAQQVQVAQFFSQFQALQQECAEWETRYLRASDEAAALHNEVAALMPYKKAVEGLRDVLEGNPW